MAGLVEPHRAAVESLTDPAERAKALATALTREGYAASTRQVGAGEQLCQHHCPVAHVAAEFPQLCEVETAAFADLLGTHVQRLATIARGDAACTTHVPLEAPEPLERNGDRSATRGADGSTTTTPPTAAGRQGGCPA